VRLKTTTTIAPTMGALASLSKRTAHDRVEGSGGDVRKLLQVVNEAIDGRGGRARRCRPG
jgi:hypothetical protein